MRPSGRHPDELRNISFDLNTNAYAEGSCIVKYGNTQVLCTATVEEKVPPFLRNSRKGWVTAEYNMLPRATHRRMERESTKGKQSGRTQEIQRLIGRSLRAITELEALGERQIIIDCDVLQADGGTRTASITGGYVALHLAINRMIKAGMLHKNPLRDQLVAVSCGIVDGEAVLDIDYDEDSTAEVDSNFVMTGNGSIVEIQGTAEQVPFSDAQLFEMMALAKKGAAELAQLQRDVLRIK